MEHLYKNLENTNAYKILKEAIEKLQTNNDVKIITEPEYVIGYLAQCLSKNGFNLEKE